MKRRSSLALAFFLAVSTVVVTAAPALAIGDITGNITDDLSGVALEGICVEAHDAASEGTIDGFATTDVNGDYSIVGLDDGDYRLYFYEPGTCGSQIEAGTPEWNGEWWPNAADHASATNVTIAGGNEVRDADLWGTGTVEGAPNGGTLNCVTVSLWDTDTTTELNDANTVGDGTYSFGGLITGVNYTVKFVSSGTAACTGLAGEWHGGIPVGSAAGRYIDAADTFTITAGGTETIDPTLEAPVTITGTMISERTGDPIEGATLRLYPVDSGGTPHVDFIDIESDAGTGVFTWDGTSDLVVDNTYGYKLRAEAYSDAGGLVWEQEWWLDAGASPGDATIISTDGLAGTTLDLDLVADLDRHGPGAIVGTVTEEGSGDPIENVTVNLYDDGGVTILASDTTDASGLYDLGEMNPADYDVEFVHPEYDTEWNDDDPDATSGTTTVAASLEDDAVETTLNAVLALADGSISGTVTEDGSGDPLDGATVTLYTDGGAFVDSTTTAGDGTYSFAVVAAGDYDLEFIAAGHVTEWYDDAINAAAGSVSVGGAEAVVADASLAVSSGSISGTVTEDGSGDPISGATVTLSTDGGAFVDSTTTAGDGTYSFPDLAPGAYDLEFTATGYITEWYDDATSAGLGSVTVDPDEAVVADAALALDVGSISGTLSSIGDTLGAGPFSGVTIEVYADGMLVGSGEAAADGSFTVGELVAGTYTVLASTGPADDPATWFPAWYVSAPLFVTDDATHVVVGIGEDVEGIDIVLRPLFIDVPKAHLFFADIVWMQASGITLGCEIDAYCPDDSVTRAQMATFLVRALDLAPDATDYFDDDDGNTHEANINALRGAGITFGCDADSFCPNDPVTRAQMASFIVRAMGYEISTVDYFIDDDGNTHEDNINTLRENGVTLGCTADGLNYCPADDVRRDQMAAFMHRALGD